MRHCIYYQSRRQLLGYVAKQPGASIYSSVAEGYQFLGNINDPNSFNHPILAFSTLTPVIVAPATEAEYAAVCANCILAYVARSPM